MLQEYKTKTNWFVGLGIGLWILSIYLASKFGFIVASALCCIGCFCYAKGKGHHGAWGLLGLLGIFGLIALVCMRDKHKEEDTTDETAKPKPLTCPHCQAVLEPEDEMVAEHVTCPVCGKTFTPLPDTESAKVVSKPLTIKKGYIFGGLAIVVLVLLFAICSGPSRKPPETIEDARTQAIAFFNEELSNPNCEVRKRIENAHLTVTVKSAYVVRCEMETLDGSNLVGEDGENIRSMMVLLRFEWEGWIDKGYTDLRVDFDMLNKRASSRIDYTTAMINAEDPELWYDVGYLLGAAVASSLSD